ncbi:peptidoglycan-binding domain-containing protein [uncultured Ruminococcus sp.]|uniref:peptidoglycan-binding domain-containing protein n=1 Tax=uncultured Ruminococcus sp. TaxID=165186 RepID=UPI002619B1B7|nr:peptidoglycan-binding domain-containing protein [uncultured Ruminococcus sp.]
MPYTDEQRKEHIRELQGYLYAISMFDRRIPQVLPDGVYNTDTKNAVEAFQRVYGLPVTGETDSRTWETVTRVYREYLDGEPAAYHAFPSRSFTASVGDSGELVYIIQAMLWKAAAWYDNMPKVNVCGEYDEETAAAVRVFRRCCGLPDSGCVDCAAWNMLVHFLENR